MDSPRGEISMGRGTSELLFQRSGQLPSLMLAIVAARRSSLGGRDGSGRLQCLKRGGVG